jgi:hypothetical protein
MAKAMEEARKRRRLNDIKNTYLNVHSWKTTYLFEGSGEGKLRFSKWLKQVWEDTMTYLVGESASRQLYITAGPLQSWRDFFYVRVLFRKPDDIPLASYVRQSIAKCFLKA